MLRNKREALHSLLMASLFYAFFTATKHIHALAAVNPFADDPYDAVGSFAVQIALFLALLSCLRSLLVDRDDVQRLQLVSRGNLLTYSAIVLTLIADVVALARHNASWTQSRNGLLLAAATFILLALSLYELTRGWAVFCALNPPPGSRRTSTIFLCVVASTICLALYPEHWRSGIVGALATAIVGMTLIFLQLGVIASTIFKSTETPTHDLVDDIAALCEFIKCHWTPFTPVYKALDRIQRAPLAVSISRWVNPRRFRWRLCILSGATFGLLTVIMEFLTEHMPDARRALLVITVFVVIEAAGVTLAYALFGQPLSLFRDDRKIA